MKRLITALVILSSNLMFAQSSDDTVRYSMIHDNADYTWFGGGLTYDLSLNNYNFTLAAFGVDAIFVHPKVMVNMHSRFHVLEGLADAFRQTADVESIYLPEKSKDFSIIGTYFFNNETESIDQTVGLKTKGNVRYVMNVPAQMSTRYGVNVGFHTGFTYYNIGNADILGIDPNGGTTELGSSGQNNFMSSYFTQHVIKLGFCRQKASRFKLNAQGYGERSIQDFTRIYANLGIGLGQKFDDVYVQQYEPLISEPLYTQYDITTNARMLPLGASIGYEWYVMGRVMGFSWIGELGIMPGPLFRLTDPLYLDLKVRIHFGGFFD